MTCRNCGCGKWSHWSQGIGIAHCTVEGCNCKKFSGRINISPTLRKQIEIKYKVKKR